MAHRRQGHKKERAGRRRRNERKMRKWRRDEGWEESRAWVRKRGPDKEAVFCPLTILIRGFPQISKSPLHLSKMSPEVSRIRNDNGYLRAEPQCEENPSNLQSLCKEKVEPSE